LFHTATWEAHELPNYQNRCSEKYLGFKEEVLHYEEAGHGALTVMGRELHTKVWTENEQKNHLGDQH